MNIEENNERFSSSGKSDSVWVIVIVIIMIHKSYTSTFTVISVKTIFDIIFVKLFHHIKKRQVGLQGLQNCYRLNFSNLLAYLTVLKT